MLLQVILQRDSAPGHAKKKKTSAENLEAQIPGFRLSPIANLQSDLGQVACLCGLILSLVDDLKDSSQF